MKIIPIVLAIVAFSAAQTSADYVGLTTLALNIEGLPEIGFLAIVEKTDGSNDFLGQLNFDNAEAHLNPGVYYGFIHERNNFTDGCNSTGQFVTYQKGSSRAFLRPADITIYKDAEKPPTVFVLNHITLVPGKPTSVIDRAVVFHDHSVVDALNNEEQHADPGLHKTSLFCGYISRS